MNRVEFERQLIHRPINHPIVYTFSRSKSAPGINIGDRVTCHAKINGIEHRFTFHVISITGNTMRGKVICADHLTPGTQVEFSKDFVFSCSKA